jgi:hypothetical protein
MKRLRWTSLVAVLCVLAPLLVLAEGGPDKEATVKASVYATAWNDKGEVSEVSLITEVGDELFVVHNAVGDELMKLVEQNVRVTGVVAANSTQRKLITVSKYEIAYN